jgi:hypothetical protein
LLKLFSLEAPFVSAGGVRNIKATEKMSFFNAKIVRCPSGGYYKRGNFFQKVFSKDDLGPKKIFCDRNVAQAEMTPVSEYYFRFS